MSRILILGCGKTGLSFANYFKENELIFFDDKIENARKLVEKFDNSKVFDEKDLDNLDFALISPGIRTIYNPPKIIQDLKHRGVKILSDYDIFVKNVPRGTKIVAITGTNGKSTTTALLDFVLCNLGKKSIKCGNIGLPVLDVNFENLDYICLEASSYQLEVSNVEFYASILLNLTNDHLEYHGDMSQYLNAKAKALSGNEISVISHDTPEFRNLSSEAKYFSVIQNVPRGTFYKDGKIFIDNIPQNLDYAKLFYLKGIHNMQNIFAVITFCLYEGFNIHEIWNAICEFKGLAHRMEFVKKINGVTFINDSKATNPDASRSAISSLDNIYLISGGVSKYEKSIQDISDLYPKIRRFYLIGKAMDEFYEDLPNDTYKIKSIDMRNALMKAYNDALDDMKTKKVSDPIILLSPLCASFDQYNNFEERGDHFKHIVGEIS